MDLFEIYDFHRQTGLFVSWGSNLTCFPTSHAGILADSQLVLHNIWYLEARHACGDASLNEQTLNNGGPQRQLLSEERICTCGGEQHILSHMKRQIYSCSQ